MLFLWSSSTYNTHINRSGQDCHTKTFFELHQSRSYQLRLRSCPSWPVSFACSSPTNAQAAATHVDELGESHREHEHKSIDGMRTSCSPNINEVPVQVKYKIKRYRSRYDIHVNLHALSFAIS